MARRRKSPWEVRDSLPRTPAGWYHLIRRNTMCRMKWHSSERRQIHKFNGGNTCWLCADCRLIVRYDSESR